MPQHQKSASPFAAGQLGDVEVQPPKRQNSLQYLQALRVPQGIDIDGSNTCLSLEFDDSWLDSLLDDPAVQPLPRVPSRRALSQPNPPPPTAPPSTPLTAANPAPANAWFGGSLLHGSAGCLPVPPLQAQPAAGQQPQPAVARQHPLAAASWGPAAAHTLTAPRVHPERPPFMPTPLPVHISKVQTGLSEAQPPWQLQRSPPMTGAPLPPQPAAATTHQPAGSPPHQPAVPQPEAASQQAPSLPALPQPAHAASVPTLPQPAGNPADSVQRAVLLLRYWQLRFQMAQQPTAAPAAALASPQQLQLQMARQPTAAAASPQLPALQAAQQAPAHPWPQAAPAGDGHRPHAWSAPLPHFPEDRSAAPAGAAKPCTSSSPPLLPLLPRSHSIPRGPLSWGSEASATTGPHMCPPGKRTRSPPAGHSPTGLTCIRTGPTGSVGHAGCTSPPESSTPLPLAKAGTRPVSLACGMRADVAPAPAQPRALAAPTAPAAGQGCNEVQAHGDAFGQESQAKRGRFGEAKDCARSDACANCSRKERADSLHSENAALRQEVGRLYQTMRVWATQGFVTLDQALEFLQTPAPSQLAVPANLEKM